MTLKKTLPCLSALFLLGSGSALSQNPNDKEGVAGQQPPGQLAGDVDLGHGYVRRGGAIHFIGGGRTGKGFGDTRIDRPSPGVLAGFAAAGLRVRGTCAGLDIASFEVLSEKYTRDKNRVYSKVVSPGVFLVIRLPQADPASFEILAPLLVRDRKHVWYGEHLQPGVDPLTVKPVERMGGVFKDKNAVYFFGEKLAGADPASFLHLDSGYYADRNRIYWGNSPVPGADLASFEVIGSSFIARDKKMVYRSGELLPGLDAPSLRLIVHHPQGFQIVSDKNGLYLNKTIFPRSQPGPVEVIDKLTVRSGANIHLVSTYQDTPVTLHKEAGLLIAETWSYDPESREPQGLITAEVTAEGLRNIRTKPLPGGQKAPSWQVEVFKSPALVQQMVKAGKKLP